MTYREDFNDNRLGDYEFDISSYRLIQEGLKALLVAIEEWNAIAMQHGADNKPYEQEAVRLQRMIDFGEQKMGENHSFVLINGMSVGSMRYVRAGLDLIIRRRRVTLEHNRASGWPRGGLRSLEESIERLETVARGLGVEPADILWEVLPQEESAVIAQQVREESADALWDVFISHASEDKERFVRPLAEALTQAGLRVWYDDFSLRVGDSLNRSINKGLSRSRYGVVVLSPSFFAKEWPLRELDGLVAREIEGTKVILPVWHEIDVASVRDKSPTLADRVAVHSREGLDVVVAKLLAVLEPQR